MIRNGSLLITDNRITSIFDTASPDGLQPDTQIIDCTNKIITPGFVDTHRHGWQTVFKTLGSNTTLVEYFFRYSALVSAPLFTPEDVHISQLTGIYEALAAGVTTILDHAHHTWSPEHSAAGLNASIESGARVFFAYAFQNSSAEFGMSQQISQWRQLASTISSNLTELGIAYDDFAGNPNGPDTLALIDLIRYVSFFCDVTTKSNSKTVQAMFPYSLHITSTVLGYVSFKCGFPFIYVTDPPQKSAILPRIFIKLVFLILAHQLFYRMHRFSVQRELGYCVAPISTYPSHLRAKCTMVILIQHPISLWIKLRWELIPISPFQRTSSHRHDFGSKQHAGLFINRQQIDGKFPPRTHSRSTKHSCSLQGMEASLSAAMI